METNNTITSHETETQRAAGEISLVFGGGNGGVDFFNFLCMARSLAKQADEGDVNARKLVEVIYLFDRLVKVANKENTDVP